MGKSRKNWEGTFSHILFWADYTYRKPEKNVKGSGMTFTKGRGQRNRKDNTAQSTPF